MSQIITTGFGNTYHTQGSLSVGLNQTGADRRHQGERSSVVSGPGSRLIVVPSTVEAHSGSAVGAVGLSGIGTGSKAATTGFIGRVGLTAVESGSKAGAGAVLSKVGLTAIERGADGVAFGYVGAVGMSGAEVGKRGAQGNGAGRVGASGSETARRSASGTSTGAVGLASSSSGGQIQAAVGSVFGRVGSAGAATGAQGVAVVAVVDSGGVYTGGLHARVRQFFKQLIAPKVKPAPQIFGRHIGGSVGLSGATSGERYITPVYRSLDYQSASGTAVGSQRIVITVRGIRVEVPSAEPTLVVPPAVVVKVPGVLPPPPHPRVPGALPPQPVPAFVGSAEGTSMSVLGTATGTASSEPDEAELVFIFDRLLAA